MDAIAMWWLSLALAAIVIVVVAVLLGMILAAAKRIDAHAAKIWTAGTQIAGNTVSLWILAQAEQRIRRMNDHARSIERSAKSMEGHLAELSGRRG